MEKYNLDEKGGLFKFVAKSPSKIVKQGDSIELKHFGVFNLLRATASDITENSFRVRSNDKTSDAVISSGDHVMLYYSSGDNYVITGEVGTVNKIEPLDLIIKVIKIEKLKDLIKEKKYCISINAAVKIMGVPESKPAALKNISFGGIKGRLQGRYNA